MKKSKHECDVESCFLCRLSMKEWLPAVKEHKKNFEYKKGELIFKEGDPVVGIYFIYKGKVKVHKKWGDDKELIIRFATGGGIFGHRGLGNDTVYPISATALETTTVCFIEKEFLLTSLKVNHDLMFNLMMFYANELQESEKNMRNMAHMSVKGRVANALLSLHSKFGIDGEGFIDLVLSRQDIASYAGTTYETVFRVLSDFSEEKLINASGKSIAIVDAERLRAIVNSETGG
ncbi:Crp/Fnr family transcriptional regulator [Pinibacter aurantiacus]|uniref:Crp/Fnr family transcriptional regulator n=1 Tax=Pinibacter aurantiacus TaxID=2851599 RepID=A0A9E2W2X8_9BACT|nr:Crp/Fnr family transcriptional regulator [Pinibacter aurantiacus]MBV4355593.1 Crp/Fnr family transcriptional regulator [Pinibacter aurantiacus]